MMRKFKILRGFVSPNTRRILTMNAQPRQRRIPTGQIPVPSFYHPELQPVFRSGWRACERGIEIYHCPHTSTDEHTVTMRRAWEYGYTECFNRDREGRAQLTTAMIDNIQQPEEEVNVEQINRTIEELNGQINRVTEMGQALGVLPTYRVANGALVSNSDEWHYLTGWESARAGYSSNANPHEVPSNEYAFWNSGWNDFVNNH
jgi:hypothetical protein